MKKVFITGISGLLGANLAFLLREDFVISGIDLTPFSMNGVESQIGDVFNKDEMVRLLRHHNPDIVVHCVAAVNVDACETDPEFAARLNTAATHAMSDLAENVGAKFIYISTDSIFDGERKELYSEIDVPNPLNVYARTKADGEAFVLANESSLVLRTNIYGYNYKDQHSFGEWVLNTLQNDKTLKMFEDVFYSPILVNDMAEVIKTAIDKDICGLYNACAKGSISKYDFGCYLKTVFGIESGHIIPISVDEFDFKAKRAKNLGMDSSKFTRDTGYMFKTPEESIVEFHRLYESKYPEKLKGA